jgi:hypothetical protein
MKNNSQVNPMLLRLMVLITCCMLVMLYNKSKAASPNSTFKKIAVEFKQDVAKNELKVFVKSGTTNSMQLYFFSADKKLVKQISVNNQHETVIRDLKKGKYIYQFLSNNLTVKSGILVLK